jgi:hypothetical protein
LLALMPLTLAAIVGLNLNFYRFLASRKGSVFAIFSTSLHLIYYCCCGVSVVIAEAFWFASRTADVSASTASTPDRRLDRVEVGTTLPAAPHPQKPRRWSRHQ